jgi:hypothetical protein
MRAFAAELVLDRTRPVPEGCPQLVLEVGADMGESTAWTPLNTPSRTMKALPATSSSATPGQSISVPGIFSPLH